MGMAASQARLLMLTSRLHDVELKAQQLQNAKLQLSTQQDAVYEDYQKALDATTLTMQTYAGGTTRTDITATFSNVFGRDAYRPATMDKNSGYILVDSRGRVVVEDDVYDGYGDFQQSGMLNNAYNFAMYMIMGGDLSGELSEQAQTNMFEWASPPNADETLADLISSIQNEGWGHGVPMDWNIFTSRPDNNSEEYQSLMNEFLNYFYSHYGTQLFNNDNIEDDYDMDEFNYYVRIYNAIQQHGGCISIDDFNGPDGSAATNSEWLTAMLQSGQLSIETITIDNHGEASLVGTSVASDTNLTYTTTTQIDKVAMAKAEADYEHAMKIIDRKEQKIDLELKKIETERTAITKEYDSIKKVSDDNVERTFGIFS